jgi:RHS repeat-associated protein
VPGSVNSIAPAASPMATQYAWALGYESNGNIGAAYDSVNGNWAYLYDGLNRLVSSGSTNGSGMQWQYDNFGNMLSQTVTGGSGTTKQFTFTLAGAAHNQPDGTCFDAAGNQQDDYGCGQAGTHEYVYDAENRVASANGVGYLYDAMGQRVAKTVNGAMTNAYLYDQSGHVVTEFNGSYAVTRREVYLGGRHLGTYDDSAGLQTNPSMLTYALTDWLGTERARADGSGTLCQTVTSQPYGDAVQTTGSCSPSPAFFTGKERDTESGLDYFGARYYGSSMGRFMSPDDFTKDTHVADPQSWNLYAYARNNPLRYVDPTGNTATVSTSCSADANNQTTCNVNISASIAIYAAPGSGLTNDQLNGAASTIQSTIQNAWSGTTQQDGVTYNVSTQVSVQVVGSQDAAEKSGAQNAIGLSNGPADPASNANALSGAGNVRGQDAGTWNINTLSSRNTAAHEFTHLLGDNDHTGAVLSNTDPTGRPRHATAADFGWALQEATSLRNASRGQFNTIFPNLPPSILNTVIVGAPDGKNGHWWK